MLFGLDQILMYNADKGGTEAYYGTSKLTASLNEAKTISAVVFLTFEDLP